MSTLFALSPIILMAVLVILFGIIFVFAVKVINRSKPKKDLENRVVELETEIRRLKNKRWLRMSFRKLFLSLILANIIAELTYLNLAFFQYENVLYNEFSWISIGKFGLDILLFGLIFFGIYYLMENVPKWCMEARYKAAKRAQEMN